ncbi:MAG: TonB family protein, partial [Caulobacteraceae bacterium]|nr:TonB family protein [Caulobacter sp.]
MTSATIRLRAEERWQGTSLSTRRLPAAMSLIAIASLAGHLAIVVAAAFDTKPPPAPAQEISVEIVQEMPKPAVKAPEPAKAAEASPKAEPKVETAKLETKPAPEPKVEPPKAPPPPRKAAEEAAKAQKLADLQKELESLKAEQSQLQAERTAEAAEAAARQPAQMRDTGLGPLPESFQAVALPAAADGQGEATSYQEIVFSALAKAKGIGRTQGLPGTAGVHFTIDAKGEIVDVELVHRSGVAALDAEALDIVHRAAPFPVPPQGAQRVFDANFTFKTQA